MTNGAAQQRPMMCRGVRGAITVEHNNTEEILDATRELLLTMLHANDMQPEDIASIYLTLSPDLDATFPAIAARQLGWNDVALLCGQEIDVPGALPKCVRVMIHWNTRKTARDIHHIYLRNAITLRPDRKQLPPVRPRQVNAMDAMMRVLQQSL